MWLLPALIVGTSVLLSIPLGWYLAKVLDGPTISTGFLRWIEARINTGPQTWKQYVFAMLSFNVLTFLVGFAVLAL